ncbi:N,N'-diacetylchitobiose transport system substrate-binding protein [Spinactinospora alkalitolerans]|uniref:N,N'-diacetylchitobiose transport system substrate-binding protein n=1 Tax=Spinactinospora alkalitolerans TaxID=687207 RepID=A0A852U0Q7_9ACTN|nr:extracellular solute-binding protein [Spinactinospora alkalitolerans]NYE49125.1 N,N'-diacetylchitobiose transport system substrate-binding protein [Spinactinospora alkalitolerans]
MKFAKVAAASSMLLMAAACGGGGGGADGGTDGAPESIEVWRMGDASEPQNEFMDSVTAEFQEEYPDTEVNVSWIPWGEFSQRFQTAMVSDGPDVVEIGNDQVQTWANAGALYDVAEYADAWENKDDFLEGAYANGTFDGAQYSVPWYSGVRALWYRTDWLEELGHEPPENWDELVEVAEAIEEEKDAVGFAAPTDFVNGIASFVWGAGGEFAAQEGEEWDGRLDSPETQEALEFYAGLTTDGISPEACIGLTEVDCAHADFANGELGMFIDGPWAEPQIAAINDENQDQWATAPIPGKDGMAPAFGGGSDLAVWATTQNPEFAFEYIKVLNSKDNATAYSEVSSMFPAYQDLLESDVYQEDPVLAGAATQATGDLRLFPSTPNWGHVQWELATVQNAARRLAEGEDADAVLPELNGELTEALNRPVE